MRYLPFYIEVQNGHAIQIPDHYDLIEIHEWEYDGTAGIHRILFLAEEHDIVEVEPTETNLNLLLEGKAPHF
jgi:hypothetical protein